MWRVLAREEPFFRRFLVSWYRDVRGTGRVWMDGGKGVFRGELGE